MGMFEYVMVLASIIIGLGITHMLTGVAGLVQRPAGVRVSWLHLLWVFYVFLLTAFWWWYEFRLQQVEDWTFQLYFFVLIYAVIVFLMSAMLFPQHMPADGDYEAYLMDRRGWFFGLQVLFGLVDVADTLAKGFDHFASLGPEYVIANVIATGLLGIGMWTRNLRFHWLLVIATTVYQVSWVLRAFGTVA